MEAEGIADILAKGRRAGRAADAPRGVGRAAMTGETMPGEERIAGGSQDGRPVRLIQDANGHFYVERDGVRTEEALHRGSRSHAVMRVEGYRPVLEVYPELHACSPAPAGVGLDDLYVAVRTTHG